MKHPVRSLFLILLLAATGLTAQTKSASKKSTPKKSSTTNGWTAAAYHGITPGKSLKADVVKALGKPNSTRKPTLKAFAGDSCCQELLYKNKGDNGGDLAIAIGHSGPVLYIVDAYKRATPRSTAYHQYGADWHAHSYSTAKCAESGGLEPIYLDKRGPLELVEYPSKGILLWPSDDSYDFFGAVYIARAPGLPKAPACVANEKPKPTATPKGRK